MDSQRDRTVATPALQRFAQRLRSAWQAEHVFLFGSRARGNAAADSDYDIIIVSPQFAGIERRSRQSGIKQVFWDEGGDGPMDLICLTPEEFEQARHRVSLVAAVLPEAIDLLLAA